MFFCFLFCAFFWIAWISLVFCFNLSIGSVTLSVCIDVLMEIFRITEYKPNFPHSTQSYYFSQQYNTLYSVPSFLQSSCLVHTHILKLPLNDVTHLLSTTHTQGMANIGIRFFIFLFIQKLINNKTRINCILCTYNYKLTLAPTPAF